MDSFDLPNTDAKPVVQDISDPQNTPCFPQPSSHGSLNPNMPCVNSYPSLPYCPYPPSAPFMPRLLPYDPSTPFSRWFVTTDMLLSQLPGAYKMTTLLFALPNDIRLWLQLKGITKDSDYEFVKPSLLNLMSITEKPKSMMDFFQRRQKPGESFAQFAIALQAILAGATGTRFSPEDQEYLVSTCFIARVCPPSLRAHLASLEHAGIVELIKAANTFSATVGNHSQALPQPRSRNQPKVSPYKHFEPTGAIQGNPIGNFSSTRRFAFRSLNY
ncbi:unnamed protein product [Hymenolepis diminuta]|uniref:Uncharacterized protein n=1 Tax=Hymenolepis diminuta TaxID=6216 RepID=A0A564YCV7_HYMDI|nr:unnamed protein product [Hymenolepis diminuta]